MRQSPYNAEAYPQGVPSPYSGQVHPYPSYEHGADYTRPVFDMTFVRQPFNVLSGVGDTGPWLPRRNRVGMPTVQPQPNPYYPHWPQVLGQAEEEGDDGLASGVNEPMHRIGLAFATAGAVGAVLGGLPLALNGLAEAEEGGDEYTLGAFLYHATLGALGGVMIAAAPIFVAAPRRTR